MEPCIMSYKDYIRKALEYTKHNGKEAENDKLFYTLCDNGDLLIRSNKRREQYRIYF